tara:strand:- start:8385 stop:9032 length:648 start_codon:yes stop_codon:yes gene_type:complete
MKIYEKIEQRSVEWFEVKWGKIGGTLSKGLNVKSDTLFLELFSQRIEEFEPSDEFDTAATARGKDLEPFAIQYLQDYTGYKFNDFGWIQSTRNELIGISPDGLTEDLTIGAEVKCFGRKKHTEVIVSQEIPNDNVSQCVHYFTANHKLEKLYFCCFRPESVKSFVKEITLDSLVNIGTNARPRLVTVRDARDLSLVQADKLLIKLQNAEKQINSI